MLVSARQTVNVKKLSHGAITISLSKLFKIAAPINVLEYSTFKILRINEIIITYIKYPIITEKCLNNNIEAITNKRQKLILEKQIAKC